METKELSEIYRLLEELIESIKAYDEIFNSTGNTSNYNGENIVYLCGTLWLKENFKASAFSEYIERLESKSFYINRIASRLREVVELGINSLSMCIDRGLNDESFFFKLGNEGEYIWLKRFEMFEELETEAKEILDIYDYVFPNSRADNTGSNKKESEELTEREIKYYGKAIEAGMAKKTEVGYKWLYNKGSNASLAYFLYKLFDQNGTGRIPFKRLGELWSVNRLDTALGQALNPKKYKQSWRTQIENLFTE